MGKAAGVVDMLVRFVPSAKAGTAAKVARRYTGVSAGWPGAPVFSPRLAGLAWRQSSLAWLLPRTRGGLLLLLPC